jgi:hypothetical protein
VQRIHLEIVTESVESVTESKAEPIEDIRRIGEQPLIKCEYSQRNGWKKWLQGAIVQMLKMFPSGGHLVIPSRI